MIADAGQLITRFGEEKGSRPRVRGTDWGLSRCVVLRLFTLDCAPLDPAAVPSATASVSSSL
jgi:hypothetical protein